jgi:hypothetical protein
MLGQHFYCVNCLSMRNSCIAISKSSHWECYVIRNAFLDTSSLTNLEVLVNVNYLLASEDSTR